MTEGCWVQACGLEALLATESKAAHPLHLRTTPAR